MHFKHWVCHHLLKFFIVTYDYLQNVLIQKQLHEVQTQIRTLSERQASGTSFIILFSPMLELFRNLKWL